MTIDRVVRGPLLLLDTRLSGQRNRIEPTKVDDECWNCDSFVVVDHVEKAEAQPPSSRRNNSAKDKAAATAMNGNLIAFGG